MNSIRNPQSTIRDPFTALLLSGGASTRMGRDKAGLCLHGQPLWRRQLETLRATNPHEILISGQSDGPYAGAGIEILSDETPGLGPLSGVVAGFRRAQSAWLLVLAIDLPAMTAGFLREVLEQALRTGRGVVPLLDRRHEPLAAIYPRASLAQAEQSLASSARSMQHFIALAEAARLVETRPVQELERALFRNVNTPADLDATDGGFVSGRSSWS